MNLNDKIKKDLEKIFNKVGTPCFFSLNGVNYEYRALISDVDMNVNFIETENIFELPSKSMEIILDDISSKLKEDDIVKVEKVEYKIKVIKKDRSQGRLFVFLSSNENGAEISDGIK